MLRREAMEEYLQQTIHYSKDEPELLEKFVSYAHSCKDPWNVYRYMEQKSICVFMPAYWIYKADLFACRGDYTNAFACVKQASSRLGIFQDVQGRDDRSDPKKKGDALQVELINQIRKAPVKGKRSVMEFSFMSDEMEGISGDEEDKYSKLLNIYENKYKGLRVAKEKAFLEKIQLLPESWLFQEERDNEEKSRQFSAYMLSNSVHTRPLKETNSYYSMQTPLRRKDTGLNQTVDSVEMLKKKKHTLEKSNKQNSNTSNDSNPKRTDREQQDEELYSSNRCFKSLPNQLSNRSKRKTVTFDVNLSVKIEHMRKGSNQFCFTPSFTSSEKRETEDTKKHDHEENSEEKDIEK